MQADHYSVLEKLRGEDIVEIRALKPEDRDALLDAVDRTSPFSLYRRFFVVCTVFTEQQIDYFVKVDFKKHVALVAVITEGGTSTIVGGGRYIVVGSCRAEIAVTVIDAHQKRGIGSALIRHLLALGRAAGLREFIAEVLPENRPMLKVLEASGCVMEINTEDDVVHAVLHLN